jgi:hypothetical protein
MKEANKYFRQALQIANEMGMDPFSPEILGVKYAISNLFEQAGHYPLACDVLEIMRVDCQRWMDEFSDKHITDGDRSRVLKVIVQLNVKLGELYSAKYMNQPEDAEKRYVEALETALKEKGRRESEGVKQGEGDWMTDEEMGGAMECMCFLSTVSSSSWDHALTRCSPRTPLRTIRLTLSRNTTLPPSTDIMSAKIVP